MRGKKRCVCAFHKSTEFYRGPTWGQIVHDKQAGKPYSSVDEEIQAYDAALAGGV